MVADLDNNIKDVQNVLDSINKLNLDENETEDSYVQIIDGLITSLDKASDMITVLSEAVNELVNENNVLSRIIVNSISEQEGKTVLE